MVTISSVRFTTAQIMLKALQDDEQQQSRSTSLATLLGDDSDSSGDSYFYNKSLIDSLGASASLYDRSLSSEEVDEKTISTDIQTASFMAGMKSRLKSMASEGDQRAREMLSALEAGTLTVTDAEAGRTIAAWDVSKSAEKGTTSKTAEATGVSDWTSFLKARLTRGTGATFQLSASGAYIDKVTGENSYFGKIGERYVYLSWPASETAA